MKKLSIFLLCGAIAMTAAAKTLRVNNAVGAHAQYTSVADALADAEDGDVIIVDGSSISYGNCEINKAVTLQGCGYFLDVNETGKEGFSPAEFYDVDITAAGATVTGICVSRNINIEEDNVTVTRCCANWININCHTNSSGNMTPSVNGIVHQNYIAYGMSNNSYYVPQNFQVTNNIFAIYYSTNERIRNLANSVIRYNTFACSSGIGSRFSNVENCVVEHNIGAGIEYTGNNNSGNTYTGNICDERAEVYDSDNTINDLCFKQIEDEYNVDAGAFAGDTPYVLSGLPAGPRVVDLDMPNSVEQGQVLKVNVKITTGK